MKKIQTVSFETIDGQRFDDEDKAKAHEDAIFYLRFVGLTKDHVLAGMERKDTELADAFERAGRCIAQARRLAGEFKRGRSNGAEPPEPPAAPSEFTHVEDYSSGPA